jgi:hypothetical protein
MKNKKLLAKAMTDTQFQIMKQEARKAKMNSDKKVRADYRDLVYEQTHVTQARANSMRLPKSKFSPKKKVYNAKGVSPELLVTPHELAKKRRDQSSGVLDAGNDKRTRVLKGAAEKAPTKPQKDGKKMTGDANELIKKAKERRELQTQKEGEDRLRKVAELEKVQAKNASMLGPSEGLLTKLSMPVPTALQSAKAAREQEKMGIVVIKHRRLSVVLAEQAIKAHKAQAFWCFMCCLGVIGGVVYALNALGVLVSDDNTDVVSPTTAVTTVDTGLPWGYITWENIRGAGFIVSGSTLRKVPATGGSSAAWDAGASSIELVNFDSKEQQGVRWKVSNSLASYGIGFTHASIGAYASVAMSQYILICSWNAGGNYADGLHVVESGMQKALFRVCIPGEQLRISISGDTITYLRDGVVIYTSDATPTFPLVADGIFYGPGAKAEEIELRRYVPRTFNND